MASMCSNSMLEPLSTLFWASVCWYVVSLLPSISGDDAAEMFSAANGAECWVERHQCARQCSRFRLARLEDLYHQSQLNLPSRIELPPCPRCRFSTGPCMSTRFHIRMSVLAPQFFKGLVLVNLLTAGLLLRSSRWLTSAVPSHSTTSEDPSPDAEEDDTMAV